MENTESMEQLIVENFYEYIRTKAKTYIHIGYEKYRKQDAFRKPGCRMTKEMQNLFISGCNQVIDYKGLTPETPFKGLGIPFFYLLMEMFHFKVIQQRIAKIKPGMGILDEMHMEHKVTGNKMKLYNFVASTSKSINRITVRNDLSKLL